MNRSEAHSIFRKKWNGILPDWKEFLAFPSISAEPAHAKDCATCAKWLTAYISKLGFAARILPTDSAPVVYAERRGSPDKPTILFYGHYDVQPPDPLDAWNTPPFTPTLKGNRMFCRGASDNKGQLFAVLQAIACLIETDKLQCSVRIIIEGTEESSGNGITNFLPKWKSLLQADILMVCDSGMDFSGAPAVVMGLRGIIGLTATLTGPKTDLHSGIHGGVAPNPAAGMAHLLSTLHNADGSIAVNNYYKTVDKPSASERRLANAARFNPSKYRSDTGILPIAGEEVYTPAERLGFRPTIEINGIHSGYGGPGSKTIIPSSALAKITSRVVAGQDPKHCLFLIAQHLKKHAPRGLKLTISEEGVAGPALRLDVDSANVRNACKILDGFGRGKTVFQWCGASIPIVAELARISGAEPLLVGFGQEKDQIHAPNESYSIDQFEMAFTYAALFLSDL